jgi:threonine aldolase
MIDLRSDTVTKPSAKMRAAMAQAEVGDDVYREDPTVNRLEARAAEVFGKEAALFVPTGTMGNTIAIKLHTKHGEEVICDARSHVLDWELSMMAWFAGCLARSIAAPEGILTWPQIAATLRPRGPDNAPTTLIALENTHNMAGGMVYPQETIDEICAEAHARGLKVHMDGARIFNAAVASSTNVARITRDVDSVMFCLSKGLGAPVGSLLVGTREAMEQGRLYRKRLGGGMRQAGVLAAAGLIALEESPAQLPTDHANARYLAERLSTLRPIQIDAGRVRTNVVIFDISGLGVSTAEFSRSLQENGVLANGIDATRMRMVTHRDVSREDCERAAEIVEAVKTSTAPPHPTAHLRSVPASLAPAAKN